MNIRYHITTFFFLALFSTGVFSQNPFIPKYDAVKRSERCFTVTWDTYNQFGAVWWADKVDFSRDTLFNFVVYMGERDGDGADGLAFVMHQDPRDTITDPSRQVTIGGAGTWDLEAATGDDGGGLGFSMHLSRVGPNTIPGAWPGDDPENHKIQPSVAIELDTWNNRDVPDGNSGNDNNGVYHNLSPYYGWDHTAVIYNGDLYGGQQLIMDDQGNQGWTLPLKPSYIFGSSPNPDGTPYHNIEDDRCYMFQVRWTVNPDGTQTLQLWADMYNGSTNTTGMKMVMTHTDDMLGKVFNGNSIMRFGFTGSTGGARNEQTICLLGENLKPFAQDDYASIPINTQVDIDIESNDNDPDGDQLHVPVIIDPAKHGQASIFDVNDINYMKYTPNTNYVGLDSVGYVTCDVNSTKCYAKCDTAYVYISIGCVPFDVNVTALSPNNVCSDSVPANGSAEANVNTSILRGTLWYEGFEDVPEGSMSDNGTSAWTSTTTGSCRNGNVIGVQNFKYRVKKSGCTVNFETEIIDISGVSDVGITVDLESAGGLETSDFLEVYYKLDGGAEVPLTNGIQHTNFGVIQASANNLNGSTLQIIIKAKNTGGDENYYWDNIHVTAVGAGTPNVTYNWYQGSTPTGPIIYTGTVNNSLHQGTYTVVARDNNTGCLSNPATVVIDSTGYNISGAFIEQLSPFTNCELPYDGKLGAGVWDGTDTLTNGYTFEWYHQEDPKIPAFIKRIGPIADNLESREYTVVITENATGCDTTLNAEVPNGVTIPTVTASVLSDIISCSDPNTGIGEANVGGITSGYRFEWFSGPAIGAGPPDYIGDTIKVFPVGTYTVQAIDSSTFCPSDPATITIQDVTQTPSIQITVDADQTSCDTLAPNGQLSGAVLVSGTPTIAGYSFNWYKGPNDVIPARPGYTGGPVADSLEAGTYRLVVVENGTNCTAFADTVIQEITVTPPDITLITADVTSCAVSNGEISITPGDAGTYIYEVYRGNGIIADSLIASTTSNVIQNLNIGDYTVIAKDIVTKCPTNPAFATIRDVTIPPVATLTIQDQTSCDPVNPTGQITVSMGFGAISDYTYEWFINDTTGTPIPPSSVDGEVVSNLDSGQYAVRITNKTTQCESVYFPRVNRVITLPAESVSSIPSTFCGTAANGQLVATVDGGLTEADGYTFIWIASTTGDTLAPKTATVTNITPGDYILTVINNTTACASNPAPVTVDDNTVIPIPVLSLSDNSSCDINNPNGRIEVINTNEAPTYDLSNYNYQWYDNSTGNPLPNTGGPNGEIAQALSKGTYELRIQNDITTCSNSMLSVIDDINIKPVIDGVTVTDASRCAEPYMSGAIVSTVNGGTPVPAGFTFEWTDTDNSTVIPDTDAAILDDVMGGYALPPGNYSVIVINEYNCPSDPVAFEIKDVTTAPAFTIDSYNNISCDPNFDIGGLVASRTSGSYSIAQYEWFLNSTSGTLLKTSAPPDSILMQLDAGTYAVRVTDGSTECTSVEYATIINQPTNSPVLTMDYIKDLTTCNPPYDGEIGLEVNPVEQLPPYYTQFRSYSFYTENSTAIDTNNVGVQKIILNPSTSNDNIIAFTSLAAGDWTSIVMDNFTRCVSDPLTLNIDLAPEISIQLLDSLLPAECDNTSTGYLQVEASSSLNNPPGGTGFSFTWEFRESDFSNPISNPGTIDGANSDNFRQKRNGLYSGYYLITALDNQSGCSATDTFFLPIQRTPPTLITSSIDPIECLPGNGTISVQVPDTDNNGNPIPGPASQFDIILYEGTTTDPAKIMRQNPLSAFNTDILYGPASPPADFLVNLPPGDYVVVARENSTPSQCYSQPVLIKLNLNATPPVIDTTNVADFTCNSNGTGELSALADGGTTGFQFEWYSGTDTVGFSLGGPNIIGLLAGNYTVKIIDQNGSGRGCRYKKTFSLPKILKDIRITDAPVTDQTICVDPNGEVYINQIEENGNPVLLTTYQNAILYDSTFTSLGKTNTGFPADPFDQIGPGTYYLTAENILTSCITPPYQIEIKDVTTNPEVTVNVNSQDYDCSVTSDGALEAIITGSPNPGSLAEYTFEWYIGDQPDPAQQLSAPNVIAGSEFEAVGLTANQSQQLYSVMVTDTSGVNKNCKTFVSKSILHQKTTVTIVIADVTAVDQTNCFPNGEIRIDQITEDDGTNIVTTTPSYAGLYTAQLLDNNLNPIAGSFANFDSSTGYFVDNTGNIDSIPAGTYYVQARNDTTGCSYGPLTQINIEDVSKNPIVSAVLDSPDYACAGGTHTGQLSPVVTGGSDGDNLLTNFAITWTVKSTGSAAPGGTTATNLWPDVYTIQVVDATGLDQGCITTRDYIVTSDRHTIDISASGTDQTICFPDGTVQVDDIRVDNVSVNNPHLIWTAFIFDDGRNTLSPPPPGSGFASESSPFDSLTAGIYYLQVQDSITKCYSDFYPVSINDISENPVISINLVSPQYSLNSNPASWTGALQATVTETNGIPDAGGYDYEWYNGFGITPPPFSNLDNINMADEGDYTFVAHNRNTGCNSVYYAYLPYEYLEPTFTTIVKANTVCSPANGNLEVTSIALDGNPDMLSDYTFKIYVGNYDSNNPPDDIIPGNDAGTYYNNLEKGQYYIVAQENWWLVESAPVMIEVMDSTTNPIISFDATNYMPVMSCDESVFADGTLSVSVTEDPTNPNLTPPFNYNYTWYRGDNTDPANILPGETTNTITGMNSGNYTVLVINIANNCQAQETFTIENESIKPIVTATQSPNTNCSLGIANGISSANVINSIGTYNFNWYEGSSVSASPDYTGMVWSGLAPGNYTVVAIDAIQPTCISDPVTIEVTNETVDPVVVVNELSPVTHCDPARPDGALSAVTQDGIDGHTFEWYLNDTLVSTGPVVSDLGLFTYTLVVTNNVTLCKTTMETGPSALLSQIPPPDIEILNDRTSCVAPDGVVKATVNGNVTNYIFRFYNKYTGEEITNLYQDYTLYDLDTTTYLVTAEDRNTGCVSEPSEFAISDDTYYPQIEIVTDPSDCQNSNGMAEVILSDMTKPFTAWWYGDNGFEAEGKELTYIPVGTYRVVVEGTDGCFSETTAEVKGDIIIYNGVSANGDGMNDYFQIICLEYFQDNNVKIYNRAGMLVYEQDNYDMNDPARRFNGYSNKGANILGTELPIGTYFYVVDKNDGSRPKVGYLELNR